MKDYNDFMKEYASGEAAKRESNILAFWDEHEVFKKTLEKDSPKGEFIFYEGPPTANGRPGIHHIEARSFKDIIPRYKTMQGYHVRRKGGWDTHGLPVELEVEKRLGLKNKKDIETFGVAAFNEECKKSVWTYASEWQAFTKRIGYWVDIEDAYVTYKSDYIESVWHVVKEADNKGLLYKDYKVVPWCARCGTGLSSHELAQGYDEVSDVSVYVAFKVIAEENTYLLAWTTTPWTLPGNVALAVHESVEYVKVKKDDAYYYVAKERMAVLGEEVTVVSSHMGSDLVGISYEPLFPYLADLLPTDQQERLEKAYTVYPASFVTTLDGTGIVHTAVMYGQDDFELGTVVGLPKFHLVDESGKFVNGTGSLQGLVAKEKDVFSEAEKTILRELGERIFKKEKVTHTYPFCWRCKQPIIYYAHDSWYFAMSKLRDTLVEENQKINWEPSHIKDGRFGEWLSGVKDWALSRERYWGTPLPVWVSSDNKERLVVDSIATMRAHMKPPKNTFVVMRHGEAQSNAHQYLNSSIDARNVLTDEGKRQVQARIEELKSLGITKVYTSPLPRTMETAACITEALQLPPAIIDDRLRETDFGVFDGRPIHEMDAVIPHHKSFTHAPEGGETIRDVRTRVGSFLSERDNEHEGESILVVTHADVVWMSLAISNGYSEDRSKKAYKEGGFPKTAEIRTISFVPLPYNASYEIDLHRPYVDDVVLYSDKGTPLTRVKEVMDVWFDSGCMPYAQDHYPFENKEWVDNHGFPADYIAEAIDQTRGWFYTLHAVGVLLGRGRAYKNVICLGHILDDKGKKMSKSLGNIVNPWEMMALHGVDALRLFMYSVNQPGDSKNFDQSTVDEITKKVFNPLINTVALYRLYAKESTANPFESPHVLDMWILAMLSRLITTTTKALDEYRLLESSRAIRDFIADLSQWYVRRSRDRYKGDNEEDARFALATTRYVLETLAKVMAPFTPFIAEEVYQTVRTNESPLSVHLAAWPQPAGDNEEVITKMETTREIVSRALKLRAGAGIKVRQPLRALLLHADIAIYPELVKEEVNVKEVTCVPQEGEEISLDTTLTEVLIEEGILRDLLRAIQDTRKEEGLSPFDSASLTVCAGERERAFIEKYRTDIMKTTKVTTITYTETEQAHLHTAEGYSLSFSIAT